MQLLFVIQKIAESWLVAKEHQRKIDERNQRLAEAKAKQEARIAIENNKMVILELEIERRKLQNEALRKKLGLSEEEFIPLDYPY